MAFNARVLYAIDPQDGTIKPDLHTNIPGLEALDTADLMVLLIRFRDLPDSQMKHIVDYVESGRPIIGLRTATHAFELKSSPTYARYSWNSKEWDGGFGRQVLGETWIDHHGHHGKQSTRGILVRSELRHPILRGIRDGDIWGPTDVYEVRLPLRGRQPSAGARPGTRRHAPERPAGHREAERSDAAGGVGEELYRHAGQDGAGIHHHHGRFPGSAERGRAANDRERLLLGHGHGGSRPGARWTWWAITTRCRSASARFRRVKARGAAIGCAARALDYRGVRIGRGAGRQLGERRRRAGAVGDRTQAGRMRKPPRLCARWI